ncbi:MAG: hypothetical protein ACO1PM_08780 [Acidovorax sp.]
MAERIEIAPGLAFELGQQHAYYTGTPAAVVAAGLVRAQDMPEVGSCTINADGSRASQGNNRGKGAVPGKRSIAISHHGRSTTARVRLTLSPEQAEAVGQARDELVGLRFPRLGGGFVYLASAVGLLPPTHGPQPWSPT